MLTEYEVHFKHEEGVDNMLNEYKLNDETLKLLKEAAPPPPKGDFFSHSGKIKTENSTTHNYANNNSLTGTAPSLEYPLNSYPLLPENDPEA